MNKRIAIEVITALLVLLFAYTALSKLFEYDSFLKLLGKFPFIGRWNYIVAWLIPLGELALVMALLMKKTRSAGLIISAGLLSAFTTYIVVVLNSSAKRPCGCGGVLKQLTWEQHIAFNSFFIVLSLIGIILARSRNNTEQKTQDLIVQ